MYFIGMVLMYIYYYVILKYGNLNMVNILCKVLVIVMC